MNLHRGLSQTSKALAEWIRASKKIAILGVGNPLRGDDGVGVRVTGSLKVGSPRVRVISCLQVPENYLGEVIGFKPDKVLFIDGVDAGLPAGEPIFTESLDDRRINLILSTHGIPLEVSASYIKASIGASTALLGIQVSSIEFGEGLTREVEETAKSISAMLSKFLRESFKP